MKLNELKPVHNKKRPKRLGRGDASGHGGTSTKGHKGQKARSGGFHKRGFEGGQMPLARRLPKIGFTSRSKQKMGIVNLSQLSTLPKDCEINLKLCQDHGWVSNSADFLKVLGNGEISNPMTVKAHSFSKTAQEKIEAAGGKTEVISGRRL